MSTQLCAGPLQARTGQYTLGSDHHPSLLLTTGSTLACPEPLDSRLPLAEAWRGAEADWRAGSSWFLSTGRAPSSERRTLPRPMLAQAKTCGTPLNAVRRPTTLHTGARNDAGRSRYCAASIVPRSLELLCLPGSLRRLRRERYQVRLLRTWAAAAGSPCAGDTPRLAAPARSRTSSPQKNNAR